MICVNIPGYKEFKFKNVVFDYNGTLAVDGKLDKDTREELMKLSQMADVYVLTADTYGSVEKECKGLSVTVKTFPNDGASSHKKDVVKDLEGESICIGNGFNDIEMFDVSDLSIAIVGHEGCSGKLLTHSDIVVHSRKDLFQLFFSTNRIKATLRG